MVDLLPVHQNVMLNALARMYLNIKKRKGFNHLGFEFVGMEVMGMVDLHDVVVHVND